MKKHIKKIILILLILLVIIGIIILGTVGFKKSLLYEAGTRIEVYLPKGYEKQEIEQLVKKSFPNRKYMLEEIEKLNQVIGIKIKEYSPEELETFKKEIANQYAIEEDNLSIYEIAVPSVKISTLVKPYLLPISIVSLLAFLYLLLRNIQQKNKWKWLFEILGILLITIAVYFGLFLIFRLPFNQYTMPLALALYMVTLLLSVHCKKNR